MARAGELTLLNLFWTILGWAAVGYGLLLLVVYLFQSRLLYYPNVPSRDIQATPASVGLEFESVQFSTGDNVRLDGWFIPRQGAKQVILFFHGNAGNISHRIQSLEQFHALGYSSFIFDYRGYGRSEGRPTEHGTHQDAQAAWDHLIQTRGYSPDQIILLGRSLGAAIATELASRNRPAVLIVESTFTSLPELAEKVYWFLPVHWLSRYRYPVERTLKKVSCPVLVVHSKDDELIPFDHGLRLFQAARDPKQFLEIRGTHDGGFMESGKEYEAALRAFLQQHLPP